MHRMPHAPEPISLQPHPANPALVGPTVEVALQGQAGVLRLVYRIVADSRRLRYTRTGAARRTDRLWEETCCEVFIGASDRASYREFNFAPSGAWAAYDFTGYRAGGSDAPVSAPSIACTVAAGGIELVAQIGAADLPAGAPLRLGLACVLAWEHGRRDYWAMRHPAEAPDFHHPGGFVLALEAPAAAGLA
jgi:hypothetical protein